MERTTYRVEYIAGAETYSVYINDHEITVAESLTAQGVIDCLLSELRAYGNTVVDLHTSVALAPNNHRLETFVRELNELNALLEC